jgi:uncharacterized protein (DUF58 family)
MVKEFELDPLAEVWIFLDAARSGQAALPEPKQEFNVLNYWRQSTQVSLPPSTEEYSVSIAASLARHFIRRGRAVGLVSEGRHLTLMPPDRGGRQLGKILEALAVSRAEGDLPIRGLIESQATHIPRGSIVILITPTAHMEFAFEVEYMLRRGLRVVAVMIDASTFGGSLGNGQLIERLRLLNVPVRQIVNGAEIEGALSEASYEKVRV